MEPITPAQIEKMIFVIRGQKVMLDSYLAELYEVMTKELNRAVRRNIDRFPDDFMFQLSAEEYETLRRQIGTLRFEWGKHRKYLPMVFSEQGVAMLSGVLRSGRAVKVNIAVMRTFVKMRRLLLQESLSERLASLEKGTDQLFRIVFQRLDDLDATAPLLPPERRKIGIK